TPLQFIRGGLGAAGFLFRLALLLFGATFRFFRFTLFLFGLAPFGLLPLRFLGFQPFLFRLLALGLFARLALPLQASLFVGLAFRFLGRSFLRLQLFKLLGLACLLLLDRRQPRFFLLLLPLGFLALADDVLPPLLFALACDPGGALLLGQLLLSL